MWACRFFTTWSDSVLAWFTCRVTCHTGAYVPENTLTDTIHHEFAHAWRELDPDFFDEDWFASAFGSEYIDGYHCGKDEWLQKTSNSRAFQKNFASCKTDAQRQQLSLQAFRAEFVSDYAATRTYEDFAETFMFYLRYRKSIDRFKSRKGVYRKLKTVGNAIKLTANGLI